MAVVCAKTPEIVAITEGSVRLRLVINGGNFLGSNFPVLDVGSLGSQQPILANPALGRGVAEALGDNRGVLLTGHGFVMTGTTLYDLVNRAYALRMNAIIQQQAIALGGTVAPPPPRPAGQAPPPQLGSIEGRAWIYWRDAVSLD